ncbi:ABC transporter [Capsaspora owczarzaki ATCC 30864]|uniref:ABC transporter n=1 Tax=Capsaspora owczarzaki (strain ATCC 30864) TaxID=595528 RepID=A0A0D2WLQ5_CAPO3|nr:ABC transporter [Capsaspora owczarzaki ATCC 30864]KJE91545.1 ABC transporter [Capsaspora owczarzaki ATCC 30864]|eukprot:XP_004349424.1 ABC transporter [Capsaspora owczarzaki ATCC 30864]
MAGAKKGGKGSKKSSGSSTPASGSASTNNLLDENGLDEAARIKQLEEEVRNNPRTVTCVLASHAMSRDVQLDTFSLSNYGHELIVDSRVELNYGRRYGLIGQNGSGKSTLMAALGRREAPIPEHIDIFYLDKEIGATDLTPLEAVIEDTEKERVRLEARAERVLEEDGPESTLLQDIYDRLDLLDADTAKKRAGEILFGLGFDADMQARPCKSFSGGWRMRISLSKALFEEPALLLLDEPTNHLDLEACVWLEEYLSNYPRCLVMVSHSQDFLNAVCTNIISLSQKKLLYYTGNYDQYVTTRAALEENQTKRYNWEQEQIAHMKDYIARFGHGSAKLARQAQSKEKVLAKMVAGGLTEQVKEEHGFSFRFNNVDKLTSPVLQFLNVSFTYPGTTRELYSKLDIAIDLDSRIALVGKNGAGKSTLLKLMVGENTPTDGMVRTHSHLRMARYHQHLADQLDMTLTPLEFMMKEFPEDVEIQTHRQALGKFGVRGEQQLMQIKNLSDGLRSRVVFSWLARQSPSLLLLDEPTNHLDIESIDTLADAIKNWNGGLVLVSHDFRLINQVANEIWLCENKGIQKWTGDIQQYKRQLKKDMDAEIAKRK